MVVVRNFPSLERESQIVPMNAIDEMGVQVLSTTMKAMKITSVLPTQGAMEILWEEHRMQNGLHAIITVVIKSDFMVRLYFYS